MSVPRPVVPTPRPEQLGPALGSLGLPAPVQVEPMAPPWAHASYRLRFSPDSGQEDLMLRRVLHAPLRDSLAAELAALSLLQHWDRLPVVRTYRVFAPGVLPFRAALSALLPGVQGMSLLKSRPGRGPAIARAVGELMAGLRDLRTGGFGTAPAGARFLARRGSWREEWESWVGSALGLARSDGVHLGPLTDRVAARLEEGLPALDGCGEFSLVHGDLHPSNLLFEPEDGSGDELRLSGLIDWEGALAGDPLVEWAVALELPPDTLGHIVAGYGAEQVAALLEQPDAVARLEVYTRTRCLTRLAWCSGALFRGEGGRRRAYALEVARQTHEAALEPDFVARKLRVALERGTRGAVALQVPSSAPRRALWRALEATHRPCPADPGVAVALSAAVSAALLAEETPPPLDRRWLELAERAVDTLSDQAGRQWSEPIRDRAAWGAALVAELSAAPPRVAFALSTLWLGLEAVARLGSVSDDVLRGLEGLVRLRRAADAALSVVGERERLAHALLGLAACERLAALGYPVDPEGRRAWRERLRHGWDDLAVFGGGAATPREQVLGAAWLGRAPALVGAELMVPALRLALDGVEGLPASRAVIWATLGLDA